MREGGRGCRIQSSRLKASPEIPHRRSEIGERCKFGLPLAELDLLTSGTCSFSAWDEAASVVTIRLDRRPIVGFVKVFKALCRKGRVRPSLSNLHDMPGRWSLEVPSGEIGGLASCWEVKY